jgi:hypothetical protein
VVFNARPKMKTRPVTVPATVAGGAKAALARAPASRFADDDDDDDDDQ